MSIIGTSFVERSCALQLPVDSRKTPKQNAMIVKVGIQTFATIKQNRLNLIYTCVYMLHMCVHITGVLPYVR